MENQNGKIFINLLLAVTLHWSLPTLPNNAQIDGRLPRSNVVKPFINRIFHLRDTCLLNICICKSYYIVALTYKGGVVVSIMLLIGRL